MAEQKKSRDLCGDDTIVSLFFARDENALSETIRKYGHLFRSVAMNLLGDPSETGQSARLRLQDRPESGDRPHPLRKCPKKDLRDQGGT